MFRKPSGPSSSRGRDKRSLTPPPDGVKRPRDEQVSKKEYDSTFRGKLGYTFYNLGEEKTVQHQKTTVQKESQKRKTDLSKPNESTRSLPWDQRNKQ